jgi:hypothetical protein
VLKRQFITDAAGNPIGVILPLEEHTLVADTLEQRLTALLDDKLRQMEQATHDPLFMADLAETMAAFEYTDAEWWEQAVEHQSSFGRGSNSLDGLVVVGVQKLSGRFLRRPT